MISDLEFWNSRYRSRDHIYGRIANRYFKEMLRKNRGGLLLNLAEGEGRNAVYAADKGWRVVATDFSPHAMEKALDYAEERNVKFKYILCDIEDFPWEKDSYDYISMIHLHLLPEKREKVFERICEAIKPGGGFIFEGFSTEQYGRESGGPVNPDKYYTMEWLRDHMPDFYFKDLRQLEFRMNEGVYHVGWANIIQAMAYKHEF